MRHLRRFKSLGRQVETKIPKSKIFIFSEGEKTERDYFEAMRKYFHSVVIDIQIIEGAGVPLTIAKKATEAMKSARHRARRSSYEARDEFWAVFDRDEHPEIEQAKSLCKDSNIDVAFSDPCFEVWLILHFEDYDRPDHRRQVQKYLGTICEDYHHTKRKTTDCINLMAFVEKAEGRAEAQLQRRYKEGIPLRPPFTTVYNLTRRIREGRECFARS